MEKRIALYDAGGLSRAIAEKLKNDKTLGYEVAGIFNPDKKDSVDIWNHQFLAEQIEQHAINALLVPPMGIQAADTVKKLEVLSIPVFYAAPAILYDENCENPIRQIDYSKPWLSVFEYHVNDHCNMNCKGCGHCANLFSEPSFTDFAVYMKDISRIRELYDGVGLIRLLGGEPLLNKKLDTFLEATRKIFPEAEIHIVTNGILLAEMSQNLMEIIVENGIRIDVSLYPPMIPKQGEIEIFLREHNIDYCITQATQFYRRFLPNGCENQLESFNSCSSSKNHLLSDGKIASCAMPFSIEKLCRVYSLQIEHNGWISIHDPAITGFEINDRLNASTNLCCYCSSQIEKYDWEQSHEDSCRLEDWIYNGEDK